MKAKEMFEKLKYKYIKDEDDYYFGYERKLNKYADSERICFFEDKVIILDNKIHLNIRELQAINKQVEELSWNER